MTEKAIDQSNAKDKPQKEKSQKPKYGMGSILLYMVHHAASVPDVLWMLALEVASGVAVSVVALYMVPSFLRLLENHGSLRELLLTIAFFSIAVICLNGLETYVKTLQSVPRLQLRTGIIMEINQKLGTCSYALLFSPGFQDSRKKARTATGNNLSATERYWETLYEILKNSICFLIYLALMVQVKPILAAATTVITILGFAWTRRLARWSHDHHREEAAAQRKGDYFYECAKSTRLAKDIRIFGMKEWLRDMERDARKLYGDLQNRREMIGLLEDGIGIGLDFLRNGITYAYLLAVTLQGGLSAAEFLFYFTAVTGFTGQIKGILSGLEELYRHSLDISCVREICEAEETFLFQGGRERKAGDKEACAFEFRDVTFCYPNAEKPVLEHFDLKIRAGEKLAVVGLNGAGKTTLARLLCGLFDPDSGEILLNGVNIKEYNRQDYYKIFGAVFQDFSVLAGTVAENVAQSRRPDMELVKQCLEKVGLRERVERFPEQYAAKLGKQVYPEEAVELSGGELQRLMLARMLYKNAPVMVLDEPASALDALAERDIYERYGDFAKGSTSIYISHRLASTCFCDRVILLGEGGILEEGTHEELMQQGGKYAELFEIQRKYYKADAVP